MVRKFRVGVFLLTFLFVGIFFIPACGDGSFQEISQGSSQDGSPENSQDDSQSEEGGSAPLPGASESFDLDLALELGRLCLQSYQALIDFNDKKTFTLPSPYVLVKQFFTTERFEGETPSANKVPIAFIATKDENIYVVFRGTVTIIEWIDDAEFFQIPYTFILEGGMTEEGFTDIYTTLHTDIVDTVNGLISTGNYDNLYVTGHSLGAALAVLAAPELSEKTSLQPVFYNFAGPRVGDLTFANLTFGSRITESWRVVNTNDLVPKLPPTTVVKYKNGKLTAFFYEHVNTEESITFGKPVSGPTDVKDIEDNHIMCNYYNALCERTDDPESCKSQADGADGCNE